MKQVKESTEQLYDRALYIISCVNADGTLTAYRQDNPDHKTVIDVQDFVKGTTAIQIKEILENSIPIRKRPQGWE